VRLGDGATGPTFTLTALPVGARSPIAATDILAVLGDLPPRQLEVLTRLVDGERVQDIAQAMYLSESTIRNHLAAIFTKAGVHSQAQLLALLREHSRVTA
jgi:two-component system response regulator DesR